MPKNPRKIEIETFVHNGKFTTNRDDIINAIQQYEGKPIKVVLSRPFKKRTNKENRYWWGVIVEHWKNILREEWGEILNKDQVHEFLKVNLNYEELADQETGEIIINSQTGMPIRKPKSTTKNSTHDQEELHEKARRLAWDMFQYEIPLPERKTKIQY